MVGTLFFSLVQCPVFAVTSHCEYHGFYYKAHCKKCILLMHSYISCCLFQTSFSADIDCTETAYEAHLINDHLIMLHLSLFLLIITSSSLCCTLYFSSSYTHLCYSFNISMGRSLANPNYSRSEEASSKFPI